MKSRPALIIILGRGIKLEEYNVFINKIIIGVEEKLGKGYEVKTERILKNNSCEYQSLLICNVGSGNEECRVSPAIRMDCWYDLYKEGFCMERIIDEILAAYDKGIKEAETIKGMCCDGENIASHIFFKVINASRNTEILNNSPHVLFEDLAVTFHYMCSNDGSMLQSFRVTEKIAKEWGMSADDLMGYAMKNAPVMFPEKFMNMESVVNDLCMVRGESECDDSSSKIEIPMYVLTNESGFNGASAILYSKNLEKLAERYNSNLYILPSSIHEVILLPQCEYDDIKGLRELVKEVNENHVELIERLSDNVYLYNAKKKKIQII